MKTENWQEIEKRLIGKRIEEFRSNWDKRPNKIYIILKAEQIPLCECSRHAGSYRLTVGKITKKGIKQLRLFFFYHRATETEKGELERIEFDQWNRSHDYRVHGRIFAAK